MANQARVTSTEALDTFRAHLIIFMNKANRAVDDVNDEVRRTRVWLQHDQRVLWESEFRKREKALAQAEQELMSVRLTGNHETAMIIRQQAVNKAKRALGEAGDKLRRVKAWNQNYDGLADPIVKRLESLRQFLGNDIPKGIAYLVNAQRALDAYAGAGAPASGGIASNTPAAPDGEAGEPMTKSE